MNTNLLRHQAFRHRAHAPFVAVGLDDRLERLHSELSAAARRLARAGIAEPVTALREGCETLGRLAELPALARQTRSCAVDRVDASVVAQADRAAMAAANLAAILRGAAGFGGAAGPGAAGLGRDLGVGLGSLESLGPHETDESLILVAETLSLAARLVLVLSGLHARRGRVRRAERAFPWRLARCLALWSVRSAAASTVRVVFLPLWTGLAHLWSADSIAAWVVAFAALIALVGRFAPSRPVLVLANLLSVVTSAALLHPVLVTLADVLTENWSCRSSNHALQHSAPGQPSRRFVVFTNAPRRAAGDQREHRRDQ